MAGAGRKPAGLGLPGGDAAQWPLQRYGRFMPLGTGEPPGPGLEAGMASSPTWKVFYSNEESGYLVLTIVISGHFFISQGQTLLEGFSLIGSKNWLKIVRRMDCLLFGTTIKNRSRMFRVQFSGECQQQALERCGSCVQSLAQYVTVQVPDGNSQGAGPLRAGDSRGQGCVPSVLLQHRTYFSANTCRLAMVSFHIGQDTKLGTSDFWQPEHAGEAESHQQLEQQQCVSAITVNPGGRTSVTQLAQSLLASEELPLVYEQSPWNVEDLGPFLRCCLMDQNFPAFVEEVEKELKKLTGLRN